jgi:steroid delta-isomerase-like uncharacterized protein
MAQQDPIAIARKVFDAWSAHDPDAYAKLLAPEYLSESDTLPAPVRGTAAALDDMRVYRTAFPDLRFTVDAVFASGEVTTVRWLASGTQRGPLMGIAPTQRRVEVRGCSILQIRNGKVTHQWLYWDTGHLLRQLGVLPERAMAAGR